MSGRLIAIGLQDMIREVRRELQQRERLYAELARTGKANKRRLDWQYDVMVAVLEKLEAERDGR
jgi:hypothetical protein